MAAIEGKYQTLTLAIFAILLVVQPRSFSFHCHCPTDLWNDVYGNFIIQKLLEFGTPDMKEKIGKRLQSGAISLSTRVFGW